MNRVFTVSPDSLSNISACFQGHSFDLFGKTSKLMPRFVKPANNIARYLHFPQFIVCLRAMIYVGCNSYNTILRCFISK